MSGSRRSHGVWGLLALAVFVAVGMFALQRRPAPRTPPVLIRASAPVVLRMPDGGSDYDLVEFGPLDGGSPAAEPLIFPLDFEREKTVAVPVGRHRVVIKSRTPDRIRDFVLNPALAAGTGAPEIALPPTLSRDYTGLADQTTDPQDGPIGFFCGFSIDVRGNRGTAILAFEPLQRARTLRYTDLHPRPDTVWPVTNLFLADPAHLTFDCPLSHADHRVTLDLADGRATVLAELVAPEDPQRIAEARERMRKLILAQARDVAGHRAWFDPRFVDLPPAKLPNAESLESDELYARHLARIAGSPPRLIEVGAQVSVGHRRDGAWSVKVSPSAP